MSVCDSITKNILVDCTNPSFGGTETTLYLFNRTDIAAFIEDDTNPLLVTGITMKATKKGFKYEGAKTSLRPNSELVPKDFSDRFRHGADFLVFGNSATIKQELEKLVLGTVVAVVENKQKNTDATFEILGKDLGLKVTSLVRAAGENEGAYSIRIQSAEGFEEPHLPASFGVYDVTVPETPVYDYDATVTALTALITV